MKATGIVRRMDDLGRVVIPKEIRRAARIREGDSIEIYINKKGDIILKKYSPLKELGISAAQYADVLYKASRYPVVVCDRDHVIAVAGIPKKELLGRRISAALDDSMGQCMAFNVGMGNNKIRPFEGDARYMLAGALIIADNDVCGSIMLVGDNASVIVGEAEVKLLETAAAFLGKQMEE